MRGISNTNLILDTRQYEVRLNYGEINKLNTNVIDDAMYAYCNQDGNAYVILEYIFDLVKEKVLSLKDQKVFYNGKLYLNRSTHEWHICRK